MKKMINAGTKPIWIKGRLVTALLVIGLAGLGQINIPANTVVSENFNSIGSSAGATLPANWRMSPSGNTVGAWSAGVNITTQAANAGLPASGGRYNWATTAGTDRSVGFLTTASYGAPNALMVYFRNTTGVTVNSITIAYAVERYIINTGSFSMSFLSSADGTTWTSQPEGDIIMGIFAAGANTASFTAPQTINKVVTISLPGGLLNNSDIYFRWTFTTTNTFSQGIGLDNVRLFAGTPTPVLTATLNDLLQVDGGVIGQFNEGDVIRYHAVIKNAGTGTADNVNLSIPPRRIRH